jgi:hypothetical protein
MVQVLLFIKKHGNLKVHECCFVWLYIRKKNGVRTTFILFEHIWFENYTWEKKKGKNACDFI